MPNYDLISNKAENALSAFITDNLPASLSGAQIVTLDDDTELQHPCVMLKAETATERIFGHGIYDIELTVTVMHQADDTTDDTHKAAAGDLFSELADFAAVEAALNKPDGADSRTVADFHVYSVRLGSVSHEIQEDERNRTATIEVSLVCQGKDVNP